MNNRDAIGSDLDRELIERALAAEECGTTFNRPKTTGETVTVVGAFRRVGRGPTVYPEPDSPDGLADFTVIKLDGGDLVNIYLSGREFAELVQLAPQRDERIALVFQRITKRDGTPFNKLSFAEGGRRCSHRLGSARCTAWDRGGRRDGRQEPRQQ